MTIFRAICLSILLVQRPDFSRYVILVQRPDFSRSLSPVQRPDFSRYLPQIGLFVANNRWGLKPPANS
ncbi:hypothetical protein [Laspinema palackyanum]|uniref:hypothetical protein n=1 Tax=Laspinema palackyanum TaxID=3231601 RepID=UPI00345D3ED8|nr:hypothetical protein [Laspinema sp. D2c]